MSQLQYYNQPQEKQSMSISSITNILHIYLQNIHNNYILVDNLLEIQKNLYNILFIQKHLQNFVCFALLTTIYGGDEVISASIHLQRSEQMSRVIYFIHFRLSRSCFSLRRNIVNHRDIQLLFFFNKKDVNSS